MIGIGTIVETDYHRGRDNIHWHGLDIHNPVFVVSSLTIIGFVVGVLVFQTPAAAALGELRTFLTSTFDWVFMSAGNLFVLFCLLLVATSKGRVHVGGPAALPNYSTGAWFATVFTVGLSIGLMFFGVAEPVAHFL